MFIPFDQAGNVDVSVCVVNWNGQALLRDLLESLKAEGGEATFETIIIDNASSDGSAAMVSREYPWVRLMVNGENEGFTRANNQAAAVARGRHLLFLNNDTRVYPGTITAMCEYLDAHSHVTAVGPRTFDHAGHDRRSCLRLPRWPAFLSRLTLFWWMRTKKMWDWYAMSDMDRAAVQSVEQMDGAALMVPRRVLDACGGWDEGFRFGFDDVDLCARLGRIGPLMYLPQSKIVHRGGAASSENAQYVLRHSEAGRMRYLAKHCLTPAGLTLFKVVMTLDRCLLPLRLLLYPIKWFDYKRRGRNDLLTRHRSQMRFHLNSWRDLPSLWRITARRDKSVP